MVFVDCILCVICFSRGSFLFASFFGGQLCLFCHELYSSVS